MRPIKDKSLSFLTVEPSLSVGQLSSFALYRLLDCAIDFLASTLDVNALSQTSLYFRFSFVRIELCPRRHHNLDYSNLQMRYQY